MRTLELNGDVISNDDIWMYDWFGWDGFAPNQIRAFLDDSGGDEVRVNICSAGGSLYDGIKIHDMLKAYEGPLTIHISGIAASAASIIAMARECYMSPASMLMIHNTSAEDYGDKFDKTKEAEILGKHDTGIAALYAAKTGLETAAVTAMMDNSTWLTANDALELGFIDGIEGAEFAKAPTVMNSLRAKSVPESVKKTLYTAYIRGKKGENIGGDTPENTAKSGENTENIGGDTPDNTAKSGENTENIGGDTQNTDVNQPEKESESTEEPANVPVEQLKKRLELLRRR